MDADEEVARRENELSGQRWDDKAGEADSMLVGIFSRAAVLADIEVKRAIVQLHTHTRYTNIDIGIQDAPVCITCHAVMDEPDDWPPHRDWSYPLVQREYPCPTLRLLASAYRGRAGWREEWSV